MTKRSLKSHYLISLIFFTGMQMGVYAQPNPLPVPYVESAIKLNYIRTWDAKAPEQNANDLMTRPLRDVQQTTQYLDGLGRPLQTVVKEGSFIAGGIPLDMVSSVLYDEFGRVVYSYLPFASTATDATKNDGNFKLNPFQQQVNFYNTLLNLQTGETNIGPNQLNWAYSKVNYEASPLNRIDNTYAPGASWVGSEGAGNEAGKHNVRIQYYTNTGTDDVKIWTVNNGAQLGDWGSYAVTGAYSAGELYKTITIDEHDKQVIEFKDKEGKVILKKVQTGAALDDTGTGQNYDNWICTYYIYDDLGNLRCVIQPEGVKVLSQTGWALSSNTSLLDGMCFRYEYDSRNRMIMKKVAGVNTADALFMVYDARDRLVMTRDAKQRTAAVNLWLVTLYDELNRPTITGSVSNTYASFSTTSFDQHLALAAASTAYPFAATALPSSTYWTTLTETGYDSYDAIPPASGLSGSLDATYTTSEYVYTSYNASPLYAQQPVMSNQVKGMVTWTKTFILSSGGAYLYSVNIYDDKARLIQVKSKNIKGGLDIVTTQYNWSGQQLRIIQRQDKNGPPAQISVILTDITYDDLGRVVRTDKKIRNTLISNNDMPAEWTTVSKNEYDGPGRLKKKELGKTRNTNGSYSIYPMEYLNYDYNVRGWLLGINRLLLVGQGTMPDMSTLGNYFGMQLGYDKGNVSPIGTTYATPQFNGNISGMNWRSRGDQANRQYDFTYDAANRLTAANFKQNGYMTSDWGSSAKNTAVNFNVSNLQYDLNGNIKTMDQYGLKLNSSAPVDKLHYYYFNNSNRLSRIDDEIQDADSKLGDFKDGANAPGSNDYVYNVNGSMNVDYNKGIGYIQYFPTIELPSAFPTPKGTVTMTHDAVGNKLRKTTVEPNATVLCNGTSYYPVKITTVTLYLNGFIYESKIYDNTAVDNELGYLEKLLFAPQEEGRIRALYHDPANTNLLTGFAYDYFIKDHLGNVRMVLTDENQIPDQYPPATMEDASLATEEIYYGNLSSSLDNKPAGFDSDTDNQKVAKLNYSDASRRIGPNALLKVMAGDKISMSVSAFYKSVGQNNSNNSVPADMIAALITAFGGGTTTVLDPGGHFTIGQRNISTFTPTGYPGISDDLKNDDPNTSSGKPKAYLNWILFDEQFNMVKTSSGVRQVNMNADTKQVMSQLDVAMKSNGYLYVYLSNESPMDVFFDNFQVTHKHGPILEETHYYPFGLTMAGISSRALNNAPVNKRKFNDGTELESGEFSDGSGLELYATEFRSYDAQIGRFHQIDILADIFDDQSPYSFAYNNPILFNDPLGLASDTASALSTTPANAIVLEEVVIVGHKPKEGNSNGSTEGNTTPSPPNNKIDTESLLVNGKINPNLSEEALSKLIMSQKPERTNEFEGFWGKISWFWNHSRNGWYYDSDGNPTRPSPNMGTPPVPTFGRVNSLKVLKDLPSLDVTGKVHGILPKLKDLRKYSKADLTILLKELKQSVQKRIEVTSRLGRDKSHGQRQGAEQDLIKSIEKILND